MSSNYLRTVDQGETKIGNWNIFFAPKFHMKVAYCPNTFFEADVTKDVVWTVAIFKADCSFLKKKENNS